MKHLISPVHYESRADFLMAIRDSIKTGIANMGLRNRSAKLASKLTMAVIHDCITQDPAFYAAIITEDVEQLDINIK